MRIDCKVQAQKREGDCILGVVINNKKQNKKLSWKILMLAIDCSKVVKSKLRKEEKKLTKSTSLSLSLITAADDECCVN